jgi:hypothetical protein
MAHGQKAMYKYVARAGVVLIFGLVTVTNEPLV